MPTKKTQTIALYFSVIIMAVASIFWVNGLILAWTAPTAVPPGSNVSAPLNVGSTGQSKAGGLILNTGGAATGLIVDQGNVGIGTAGPTSKLSITGSADAPSLTAASGLFRLDGTGITGLSMGIQSASPYGTYLQSTNQPATGGGAFPLLLNPLGGNVGIGTAAPASKLQVAGTIHSTSGGIKFPDNTVQTTAAAGGGIPSGFCIFSRTQTGCPTGWTRDSGFDSRTIRGAATPGGTGGADTHTHTIPALYLAETGQPSNVSAGGNTYKKYTVVSNSGAASSWAPYMNVIVCCKN